MKKKYLRLALVALPALFVAACGGDDLGALDMGSTGTCPEGTTVYKVANGTYPPVANSAMIVSDGCSTGITAAQLETNRTVQNDGQGNITLYASDGSTIIGTGPVRCNGSTLSYGPVTLTDGADVCQFTANYSVNLSITADNTFTMQVTQARSNSMSVAGMTCAQPPSCSVVYSVSQKM